MSELVDQAARPPGLPLGTPLQVATGPDTFPLAKIGTLDPRNAMAKVLAAYLLCTEFVQFGEDAPDTKFVLDGVDFVWPEPDVELEYPRASIVDGGPIPYREHSLTPTALEGTWQLFEKCTVLWKTGEAYAEFQVDFWFNHDTVREAVAARLPSLFNPGEGRSGVVLSGHPRYFHRDVRATLLENERLDEPAAVYTRERRLRTRIRCEVDVVQLRQAVMLQPRVQLREVGEDVALTETDDC